MDGVSSMCMKWSWKSWRVVTCAIPSLDKGASKTFTIVGTPLTAETTITNTAKAVYSTYPNVSNIAFVSTNVVKFTCSGNVGVPGQTTPPVCPSGSLLKIVVKTPDCLADHTFHNAKDVNATPFSTLPPITLRCPGRRAP